MGQNVHFVQCGESFGCRQDSVWLAYSSLNGAAFLVSEKEKEFLRKECESGSGDSPELSPGARALLRDPVPQSVMRIPESWEDVYEVDFLMNYKCNFHCVYCYSAAGRSNAVLPWEKARTLVDFLFSEDHAAKTFYNIHFSGGGEPTLSFDLVRMLTEYIEKKAAVSGHKYKLSMVTNGSLLSSEIMDYLIAHNIELILSFEILEQYQNAERGQYDVVAKNLDRLIESDVRFAVRATLTADSAPAMPRMIEEIHTRFPGLKAVVFDTVLSAELFRTPEELKKYYDVFFDSFLEAEKLGEKYHVSVSGPFTNLLAFHRERTCFGKIVLTPEGRLSICARVSSPKEELFPCFTYGEITEDGRISVDREKFDRLMHENTIESAPECRDCFARWNCGGGCRLFTMSFPDESRRVFCDFQRKCVKYQVLEHIRQHFLKANGKPLEEHLKSLNLE